MKKESLLFLILLLGQPLFSQDFVSIESIRWYATFHHISCHVDILGDDNGNSSLELKYKLKTESNFQDGAETMRARPSMIVDKDPVNLNFHAGSVMFLEANSVYDIQLILTDPDGGSTTQVIEACTKNYPKYPTGGTVISVTSADGPNGIQEAIDNASSGDIIEVDTGTYLPFSIQTDRLYVRSKFLHKAVIDGNNTDRGVITVGNNNDSIQWVMLDGFKIQNGEWGVDAQNTQYFTVQNCDFTDVSFGIVNRREKGWVHDQYITNNRLVGRTVWPQSNQNIPKERGIDIRGNNNVVSYNSISHFGDGIATDGPPNKNSYSLDIYHNDVFEIVDDLLEVDGMVSNSRVYNNRAFNGRAGISLAPVYGGPAYVFRNLFANMEYSTYKMNRAPAGLYIVHNTTVQEGDGMSSDTGWQNTVLKNNLVFSGFYCFQEYGLIDGSSDDWDYNGYYSAREGTSGTPWFKWDNDRYAKIPELIAGTSIETNAVEVNLTDLVNVVLPTSPFIAVSPGSLDLNLSENSSAENQGLPLPNINLPFVSDGMPDLGAKEKDSAPVRYGHDWDELCGRNDLSILTWTGAVNHSWTDRNNWSPCGIPNEQSEVFIPLNMMRLPTIKGDVTIKNFTTYTFLPKLK